MASNSLHNGYMFATLTLILLVDTVVLLTHLILPLIAERPSSLGLRAIHDAVHLVKQDHIVFFYFGTAF